MIVNTHGIELMLNDQAKYWIAGGYYFDEEQKAVKEKALERLKALGLDVKDFEFSYFMDNVLVSKKCEPKEGDV
jgi:hypothetical protein